MREFWIKQHKMTGKRELFDTIVSPGNLEEVIHVKEVDKTPTKPNEKVADVIPFLKPINSKGEK